MTRDEKFKKYVAYKEIPESEQQQYVDVIKKLISKEKISNEIDPSYSINKEEKKKEKKSNVKKTESIKLEEKKIEMANDELELNI